MSTNEESVKAAIDYCIENNILKEFLEENREAVIDSLTAELCFNQLIEFRNKEGNEKEKLEIARNLLAEGSTPEFVQEITGLDMETIRSLNN
ncbi:MAG: hypothetical protein FWD87_02830 [Spirochaetaceae bacterium]|nr:hypothetical protein [Spirochaetaceae bacterium]